MTFSGERERAEGERENKHNKCENIYESIRCEAVVHQSGTAKAWVAYINRAMQFNWLNSDNAENKTYLILMNDKYKRSTLTNMFATNSVKILLKKIRDTKWTSLSGLIASVPEVRMVCCWSLHLFILLFFFHVGQFLKIRQYIFLIALNMNVAMSGLFAPGINTTFQGGMRITRQKQRKNDSRKWVTYDSKTRIQFFTKRTEKRRSISHWMDVEMTGPRARCLTLQSSRSQTTEKRN